MGTITSAILNEFGTGIFKKSITSFTNYFEEVTVRPGKSKEKFTQIKSLSGRTGFR
jgi:hypothetical protein